MTAYEEFERRLADRMAAVIRKVDKDRLLSELLKAWESDGFDLPGLSKEEWFHREVAWHFWEISRSFETLKHTPVYLRFFPKYKTWATHGITPRRHLRYHIEHYLEETYILQLRVKTFLDWLAEQFRVAGLRDDSNRVETIKRKFVGFMKQHARTRGMHVHRKRYSDQGLWWMDAVETAGRDDPDLVAIADEMCELYRGWWRQDMQEKNEVLGSQLDVVFSQVGPIVFADWGQVEA